MSLIKAMDTVHQPILLKPITDYIVEAFKKLPLDSEPHWFLDCTFGGGGHTGAILEAFQLDPVLKKHRILAIDQDQEALERGKKKFAQALAEGTLELKHARISELNTDFLQTRKWLGMLADLGFSSDQIESSERGLSFRREGPLDMRLDPSRGQSAFKLLQSLSESEIVKILSELGEERFSKTIARAIVNARSESRLPTTTTAFADLISRSIPPFARHGRIHPATRTFQALRIAVNEELEELDHLLQNVILNLEPSGRAAVLSFHSLEDRRVKQVFKKYPEREGGYFRALMKKPLEADEEEQAKNPRSRSAKLRVGERIGASHEE